ncbi:hypothetical protein MKZ15_15585 [Paenibacillus sp. FSL R7-0216]
MNHNLQDIKEVRETKDADEVNQLLKEGWVLDYRSHEPSRSRYVLVKFE